MVLFLCASMASVVEVYSRQVLHELGDIQGKEATKEATKVLQYALHEKKSRGGEFHGFTALSLACINRLGPHCIFQANRV